MIVDHLIAYIAASQDGLSPGEARLVMCQDDPLFFALTYFPYLLAQGDGSISLADPHVEWCEIAKGWMDGAPSRDAFVAPRALRKTTWWLLILPLWGAAFGHVRFVFWAADAACQAQEHLGALRQCPENRSDSTPLTS